MKRLSAVFGIVYFVILMNVVLFAAEAGVTAKRQLSFKSASPRYAKIVLNEDKTKVLSVVFDESKGTGIGYDLLYADTNFNGIFEENEKFEGKAEKGAPFPYYKFSIGSLEVPYNEKGMGIANPCSLLLVYLKPLNPPQSESQSEIFYLQETIKLHQGSSTWEYFFTAAMNPSNSLAGISPVDLVKTPEFKISTAPDLQKKGNLGIALSLVAGDIMIQCKTDDAFINAGIEIKTKDGKVVHQDTAGMDKFVFTWGGGCGYSVRIPSGEYKLEATTDSGPLWGVLKAVSTVTAEVEVMEKGISREQAQSITDAMSVCMSNLKQMGLAMHMYAQDHENKFPDDLGELYREHYVSSPSIFWCPADTDPKPTEITNSVPNQPNSCQISYTYYPGHSRNESNSPDGPAKTMLVEDNNTAYHNGRKCRLFADGHVELRWGDAGHEFGLNAWADKLEGNTIFINIVKE